MIRSIVLGAGAAVLAVFGARRGAFMAAALGKRRSTPREEHAASLAVVIPALNEAATVARSLESLASARPPAGGFSVVLVDDGSQDATGEIMERFASTREGWSVVRGNGEGGKSGALNAALPHCSDAELVAACDADVRLDPDCLRELVAAFSDPGVGAACGLLWPANATASRVARYCALELWQNQLITSAAKDRLGLNPPALGWASCYRQEALAAIGGFRSDAGGEDVVASNDLTVAGWRTRFVPTAVVHGDVPYGVSDYWHQHVRWARGLHGAAPSGPRSGTGGRARRVEAWILSAGYLDRLVLAGLLADGVARRRLPVAPLAYLAISAVESLLALRVARVPARKVPGFAAAAALMLPVDVAMAAVGSWAALAGRRSAWRSPRRMAGDQARSSTWRNSAWPASETRSRPRDLAR